MYKVKYKLSEFLIYLLAIMICIFSLIPIVWSISTSLKPSGELFMQPPHWIPKNITFEHYRNVLNNKNMVSYFVNSFIVAFFSTIIALIIGVLGAYGFSRYKFPGRNTLFYSILFTRILPRVSLVVPFFVTLKNMNLYNKRAGLVFVYLIITMPLSIWLLKGFIDNNPYEIEEAATIDGCGPLRSLLRILLPINLPAISAVGMYVFIVAWNEFLFALTMTQGKTMRTISVGLAFYIDENGIQWGSLMAASILMSIPAIIVFSLFQKNLIRGLSEGAVKG